MEGKSEITQIDILEMKLVRKIYALEEELENLHHALEGIPRQIKRREMELELIKAQLGMIINN